MKGKDMISSLLDLKNGIDAIWGESLFKNEALSNTIKDAFKNIIKLRPDQPTQLIAKCLDEKLWYSNKGTLKEESQDTLDRVLILFGFSQGKDVFEAFYKMRFFKRISFRKKLWSSNKGALEEESEDTLDIVLILFRFIQGKDVFEAFYKRRFFKRIAFRKKCIHG
jgi:cullin-4